MADQGASSPGDSSIAWMRQLLGELQAAILDESLDAGDLAQRVHFVRGQLQTRLSEHKELDAWEEVLYRAPFLTARVESLRERLGKLLNQLAAIPPQGDCQFDSADQRADACDAWQQFGESVMDFDAAEHEVRLQALQQDIAEV